MKQKCRLSVRSDFLSSRIQETESKLFSATRARVEFGGITDVETGGVSGLEGKLVCSFKLAAENYVVLCYLLQRTHYLSSPQNVKVWFFV